MFSELPKLFDRDFLIGYFLPGAYLIFATYALLNGFGLISTLPLLADAKSVELTTYFILASWLVALLLLLLNYQIMQFLEGYGSINPVRILLPLEKLRYAGLMSQLEPLKKMHQEAESNGKTLSSEHRLKLRKLAELNALSFPDSEELILPTGFGNALRAFEIYPRVMFGIDAIQGWSRLTTVVPSDYLKVIDGAKAQMDAWMNLWLVSLLIIPIYYVTALFTGQWSMPAIPMIAILAACVFSVYSTSAAIYWGELVKSAFDVFLPSLQEKLSLRAPRHADEEFGMWQDFSRAMLFRRRDRMPARRFLHK